MVSDLLGLASLPSRQALTPHVGVLPGGKHEVGKIDERAKHNKESAMKMSEQAEANLLEAKDKADALQDQGLSANTELPRKASVGDSHVQ